MDSPSHIDPVDARSTRRVRRVANTLVLFFIVVILGVTLYPFDFTTDGLHERLRIAMSQRFRIRGVWDDIITNVVLFLPLGYVLATLSRRTRLTMLRGALVVTLTSAGLSLLVEILQLYLPFRFSSFTDVASNATGAAIGYVINATFGQRIAKHMRAGASGKENSKTVFWLSTTYVAYLVFILMLSVASYLSIFFIDWGWEYPLVVGNEPGGARPWVGTMYRFAVGPPVSDEETVLRSFASDSLSLPQPRDLTMNYKFEGSPPIFDRRRRLPPLEARGRMDFPIGEQGVMLSPYYWLETPSNSAAVCGQLYSAEGFSIFLKLQSAKPDQVSQARIFNVAADIQNLNMALTQEGTDLCFRFRTMATGYGGGTPMFSVAGVFSDTLPHSILLTYQRLQLDVYIDRVTHKHSLTIGPGLPVFNRFLPTRRKLNIASPIVQINEWLFALFAFVPLGYFLALIVRRLTHKKFAALIVAIAGVLAPVYTVGYAGSYLIGRAISEESVLIGTAIIGMTIAVTLYVLPDREEVIQPANAS